MSINGGSLMCKAAEVGKIVINKCLKRKLSIDTQKLQKLLVLMQIECIKRTGKPLFKEDIRIWDCGVAIKEVDEEFRGNGEPFNSVQEEYINLLDEEEKSVNYIIDEYGEKDAIELNCLSTFKKVQKLGVADNNSQAPHINCQILIGAFFYK